MKTKCFILAAVFILSVPSAHASRESFSIGLKGGTLGVGLDVGIKLDDDIRFRLGTNYISYNFDVDTNDFDYDYSTNFKNVSLLFDWHPFSSSLFVTAGAYLTDHTIEFTGEIDPGGLSAADASKYPYVTNALKIKGEADLGTFAPYLGLGWRTNHRRDGFSLACELGILLQSSPNVEEISLVSAKDGKKYTDSNKYLDTQIDSIEDDIKGIRYYPVASVWMNYNF